MELQLRGQSRRQNIIKKTVYNLQKISARKIMYGALIFFISLARLPFGSFPLGCAVFAAEFSLSSNLFVGALVLLAGFIGNFSAFELIKSAAAILIFSAAATKLDSKNSPFFKSIIMSLSILFSALIPKLFGVLYLYDTVLLFAESMSFFLLTLAFYKAKNDFLFGVKGLDGIACAAVLASAAIMGASTISWGNVNLGLVLSIVAILIFSYENGASAASIAGIITGFTLGISLGSIPYFITLFAVASLLAGVFSPYGKAASAASYVLSASFATLCSPNSLQGFVNLTLFSFSALIFMLLPKRFTSPFSVFKAHTKKDTAHFKEYVSRELSESAEIICDISKAFKSLSKIGESCAATSFFERATNRLCNECSLKGHCWKNEFHRTYSAFFVLTELCNKHGSISYCDIPSELSEKCVKVNNIVNVFNFMYDIYKVDKLWEKRINESREVVASQLSCISSTLREKASTAMESACFLPGATAALAQSFSEKNIETEKICVFSRSKNEIIVDIVFPDTVNVSAVTQICQNTLNGIYHPIYLKKNFVRLSIFPPHNFTSAIAQKPKNQSSTNGDTAIYSHLPNQQYVMLLSDGMGYGEVAASHSKNTATLALKLLQGGVSPENAAEIINSTLILKSTEVSFSSVDMAVVDFNAAYIKFYKMGAAPSFIKNGKTVKTIYATTLPAGTFSKSDISYITHPISKGDMIIMVSDGVANGENTEEIEKIISEFSGSAKEMANMLLSYSGEHTANDDVTVMATCIN